jgi:hypothetical protein
MGYRNIINSNLARAFNQVKDLAVEAVLVRRSDPTFDFNSGETTTTDEQLIVKVIALESEQKAENHNVVKMEALMKSKEIGAITPYDTLEFEGHIWNFGKKSVNSGFVFLAEIYREA